MADKLAGRRDTRRLSDMGGPRILTPSRASRAPSHDSPSENPAHPAHLSFAKDFAKISGTKPGTCAGGPGGREVEDPPPLGSYGGQARTRTTKHPSEKPATPLH